MEIGSVSQLAIRNPDAGWTNMGRRLAATISLALLSLLFLLLLVRLARPDAKPGALGLWLFAPLVLLGFAVSVELAITPASG